MRASYLQFYSWSQKAQKGTVLILASTLPGASAMGANARRVSMREPVTVARFQGLHDFYSALS